MQLPDLEKLCSVLVPKRIMLQQFPEGENIQLLVDQSGTLRANSFEKLYLGVKKSGQGKLIFGLGQIKPTLPNCQ
tara:strand:+ start:19571 stop:19795 length:225 start_codon:yes stop_codon:yes gene_type:complete